MTDSTQTRPAPEAATTPGGRAFAVVTGASSGIGYELAKQFAEHDFDVLISAEDDELDQAAEQLKTLGTQVRSFRADLRTYQGVEALVAAIQEVGRVDAIALNAGIGAGGPFATGPDLSAQLDVVQVNVTSQVHLARRVLPTLVEQGSGRVLFTSSIAATQPGPFEAVYAASKAFIRSFAEALRVELKDSGVTVTTLLPGPTDTEFFERAGLEDTKLGSGPKDDPTEVARQGFEALMKGADQVVAGSFKNKVMASAKGLPEKTKAAAHAKLSEPGSADN
ncbi:MAG TPA: SDR family NAD(P)-dependent oxidoreductase [Kineosporiaceae bacterium]|nr:SDR family NAD(P)-dependent oxidoreductase [Kineosporiaceae bacterium]